MKTDTRMILAPLAALAVAFGAQAFSPQSENFESYTVGEGVGGTGKFCFVAPDGVYDDSTVQEADNNKYLQVSVEEGALFRSINDLNNGEIGTPATVGAYGIDVDMSMKFTVTAAGDEPEYSADDKLSLWLQDEGSATNLMARGGLYTGSAGSYTLTPGTGTIYRLTGVTVTPGVWTSVKLKAIADIGGEGIPGFEVWVGETRATVTLADGLSAQVDNTAVPSMSSSATLAAVGFSGEGAVDDIRIEDQATAGTVIELVSGVTNSYNEATGAYTFGVPEGFVIGSLLVNGDLVSAAAGQTSYTWTSVPGASVVVAATKQLTAAEHPWYENPGAVVLAENMPKQTPQIVSVFHGQGQEEFLGLTYSTSPKQFDLFTVDGLNALVTNKSVVAADVDSPGFRGVAISKTLGIAMTLAYATSTTMYAFPLDGGEPTAVVKPSTHSFDAGAFSPDGKYFFSNALNGESGNTNFVKWAVSVANKVVTLTKVGNIAAGGRGRNMAYARINGRDLVFAMADTGLVDVIDMTGDDPLAWSKENLLSDLPSHSYGSLCISGVKATGATPTLTVATSLNGASYHSDVLNVYGLSVPAAGTVTTNSLIASFNEAQMTAAGFGDISDAERYGNTVYVTDDNKTIYFGRGDCKLYAGEYAVASIYNTLYTNFTEAVSAITNADDYVTLFANASTTMAAGDTLKVKTNGYTFTPNKATDDVVISYTTDGNNVTTYTTVTGVAKCNDTWYATFAAAYDAALAASGNATMIVRITDDFTPAISTTYNHFYSLTFEDVRADQSTGLTINLKNSAGTAYMKSSRYFFPSNATLVLAADWAPWQAGLATGGTLEIPAGIEVFVDCAANGFGYSYLNGLSGVSGAGTIKIGDYVYSDGHTDAYYILGNPDTGLAKLLQAAAWQGTLELTGGCDWDFELAKIGNANSKVRFNGFTTMMYGSGHGTVGVELVGDGLSITGAYDSARTYTIDGAITGSGALTLTDNTGSVLLSGDVSGFTGDVTASGTSSAITFGSSTVGSGQRIVVGGGESVTNAVGATWTAANVIVRGELVANGTVAASTLWGDSGTGIYRANNAAAAIAVANSWNGTYYANFKAANNAAFYMPVNASATTVINGANGEFGGYPKFGSGAPNVAGEVVLNADWTVADGWDNQTTTFAKLTGSGDLTVNGAAGGSTAIPYAITELDNYTGVLGGARSSFTIGKVNVATQPADGARVVAVTNCNDNVPLYINGVDSEKTLTYNASGAEGAGLYYVAGASGTYPTYVGSDATLQSQYDAWKATYGDDTGSAYETAFLLNVDPATGDTTLDATAVTISGTTVTITIDHNNVNGYPYVKIAATLDGLSSATPVAATVVNGIITLPSQTGAAAFYKVGVSSTPID